MPSSFFPLRRPRTALLLAASVLALAAPAAPALASPMDWIAGGSIKGSGKLQKQQREVGRFNGVALNVPGTVELRIGNTDSVTIETDDNLLPLIETVVENGTLRIRQSRRNSNLRQTALTIVVQARQVERVSVGGSGTINASGLSGEALRFDVGGSGSIHAGQLDARLVSVAIGGSGNFSAGGKTQQLTASIGGSGNIDAGRLAAKAVQVSIGGSGEAEVWAKEHLTISIGGSGEVSYYGDPQISRSMQRSSSVKRLGVAPN
ncbi:head GIN domain-containing protein [Janthinobacterium psychrotolerans]|uniref:Putative auto-transporter adhesin, head GIN domain n=1 Tax=Janthinobacterium psychrotolerans TaxID=1747903 RepID=A0A1A7C318_9BURK|nr:head GIN domain-containing protein [Janthinobacterium psychrotolerans]OBV40127.1 putative auto-transporter adhesin, head GIN domain [Janthinobacterium psychrotolerans]